MNPIKHAYLMLSKQQQRQVLHKYFDPTLPWLPDRYYYLLHEDGTLSHRKQIMYLQPTEPFHRFKTGRVTFTYSATDFLRQTTGQTDCNDIVEMHACGYWYTEQDPVQNAKHVRPQCFVCTIWISPQSGNALVVWTNGYRGRTEIFTLSDCTSTEQLYGLTGIQCRPAVIIDAAERLLSQQFPVQ